MPSLSSRAVRAAFDIYARDVLTHRPIRSAADLIFSKRDFFAGVHWLRGELRRQQAAPDSPAYSAIEAEVDEFAEAVIAGH